MKHSIWVWNACLILLLGVIFPSTLFFYLFFFGRSHCVLCSCALKHIFTRAAVPEGQETWGCTVMWFHFMSGALPLLTGYQSKSVRLPDCSWCLCGCPLSCRATIILVGWPALIKTTDVCVCTAVRTKPITPAAFNLAWHEFRKYQPSVLFTKTAFLLLFNFFCKLFALTLLLAKTKSANHLKTPKIQPRRRRFVLNGALMACRIRITLISARRCDVMQ